MEKNDSSPRQEDSIHLPGVLYIVATPIGNLEDITLRALRVLKEVDLIAAEDTRHTGKLLSHYQINAPLISCHEHNESGRTATLIEKMKQGKQIALVSDAGTPCISDPGYRLVKAAVEADITVVPIPGASAVVSGLSVCGLPTDAFHFVGFLPKKKGRRATQLEALKEIKATLVFYESPKRLLALVQEIVSALGDRPAMAAREISKMHEEFIRGSLLEIADQLAVRKSIKGECALFVGRQENGVRKELTDDEINQRIADAYEAGRLSTSKLAAKLAADLSRPKQEIYDKIVKLKKKL